MSELFTFNAYLIVGVIAGAMLLGLARLVLGPSLSDRVVALDLIAVAGAGLMAAAVVADGQPWYLDVALLLALIGFLGTAAFAHYIVTRGRER